MSNGLCNTHQPCSMSNCTPYSHVTLWKSCSPGGCWTASGRRLRQHMPDTRARSQFMTPHTAEHTRRHILLCVAGLTPQIITETLYALTQQRGERVDEIRVITTLGGRDRIRQALLDPQQGKFFAFCRDYHLDPASITFDE